MNYPNLDEYDGNIGDDDAYLYEDDEDAGLFGEGEEEGDGD